MKRILLSVLAMAFSVVMLGVVRARDEAPAPKSKQLKTVAVVSVASYDQLMGAANMLGMLASNPDLEKNIEEALKAVTHNQGLAGLDRRRPVGLLVATDGADFLPLAFIPVTNYRQLLDSLVDLVGDPLDAGSGVKELTVKGVRIYVKAENGWAFVAQSREMLAALPPDPVAYLAGLNKTYDVGLRLWVQNIPDAYRTVITDQLRETVQAGMGRGFNEAEADYLQRRRRLEEEIARVSSVIAELDQITLGGTIDVHGKSAFVDVAISGMPGTRTAKSLADFTMRKSDFSGFVLPGTAASFNLVSQIDPQMKDEYVASLRNLRKDVMSALDSEFRPSDASTKRLVQDMVAHLMDAMESTLSEGKIDAAALLNMNDRTIGLVAGVHMADPTSMETALKKFSNWAEQQPDFPGIRFDAEKHDGIRFHTTSLPIPAEESIARVLDGKLDLAVGIGKDSVYFAVGKDSLPLLKDLIDRSKLDAEKLLPPLQANANLSSIFQFAEAMQRPGAKPHKLVSEMAKGVGKDRVSLIVMPQPPNAIAIRIEGQEGVLRLLSGLGIMAAGLDEPELPPGAIQPGAPIAPPPPLMPLEIEL